MYQEYFVINYCNDSLDIVELLCYCKKYHKSILLNIFSFLSEIFRKVLITTIVNWAEETQIETPKLVREMFSYNCFHYITVVILISTYLHNTKCYII